MRVLFVWETHMAGYWVNLSSKRMAIRTVGVFTSVQLSREYSRKFALVLLRAFLVLVWAVLILVWAGFSSSFGAHRCSYYWWWRRT